ncbi:YcnI family protein [Streptomyces sp. NPDC058960]|uniref:YcnI family protein n=1 Tax=Streptomyces sp. NPDC058960 TaxID=3346679 RepID=UPI0036776273
MPSRFPRPLLSHRLPAAALAGAAAVLILAPAAAAHVTIQPKTSEPGGYAKEAFRVPNERDNASTVQVEVAFPADHPLASVAVQPVPGWTATVHKQKLATPLKTDDGEVTVAVTSIVWKGGRIEPGQFQEFPVSVGPLPTNTDSLVFKALQTYSDGTVVRWIDVPQQGAPEPEHPAPVLTVRPAAAPAVPAARPDTLGRVLGSAGLAAGVAAIGWSLSSRRRKAVPQQRGPAEKPAKVKSRV